MTSGWDQTGDPTTYAWENHEYTEKDGQEYLDQCNGRVQPDGSYGYHATASFPYILGCYTGTPADSVGSEGDRGGPGAGDGANGGGPDGAGGGPPSCEDDADCTMDQCPDGSVGCACATGADGDGRCVPTCTTDADCPEDGIRELVCDTDNGWCRPAGGPA